MTRLWTDDEMERTLRPVSYTHLPTGHRLGAWHGKAKHGPEVVRQALTLHYQGFSYAKIGQRLGVSEWTIADWCQGKTRYVDAL